MPYENRDIFRIILEAWNCGEYLIDLILIVAFAENIVLVFSMFFMRLVWSYWCEVFFETFFWLGLLLWVVPLLLHDGPCTTTIINILDSNIFFITNQAGPIRITFPPPSIHKININLHKSIRSTSNFNKFLFKLSIFIQVFLQLVCHFQILVRNLGLELFKKFLFCLLFVSVDRLNTDLSFMIFFCNYW